MLITTVQMNRISALIELRQTEAAADVSQSKTATMLITAPGVQAATAMAPLLTYTHLTRHPQRRNSPLECLFWLTLDCVTVEAQQLVHQIHAPNTCKSNHMCQSALDLSATCRTNCCCCFCLSLSFCFCNLLHHIRHVSTGKRAFQDICNTCGVGAHKHNAACCAGV